MPPWLSSPTPSAAQAGFRFGDRGTHTSRTLMLVELRDLLAATAADAKREDYLHAILDENVLGKPTLSSRRLTSQRLCELYALDPAVPIFRILRRLWLADEAGRPLIALLCALARDPLLRASAPAVLDLIPGAELVRATLTSALRTATGSRLNDAILDKVARNAGSSWCQSGHLLGRVRKIRQRVVPTPAALAFAAWLGEQEGGAGEDLLRTPWAQVLDQSPATLLELALRGKNLGLIHARSGGNLIEIDASGLDPLARRN